MNAPRTAFAVACAVAIAPLLGCEQKVPEPEPPPGSAVPAAKPAEPEPADLAKEDVVVGTGQEAKEGDEVRVHYTGRLLKNGVQFDSSVGSKPFDFKIGEGQVIKGWDQGVPGMKVGGKRKLTIPSKLGYGDAGSPPKIPAKATLVFDIELLAIGPFKADDGAPAAPGASSAKKGAADKAAAPKGDAAQGAKTAAPTPSK